MSKATFYIQFLPVLGYDYKAGNGKRVVRAKAVRMTQRPPQMIEGERVAVVKLVVELPDRVFEPWLAEATIEESDVEIVVAADEPAEEAVPA